MKALVILVALTGCDWQLHRMQEPGKCTVHGATTLLPNDACDMAPPEGTVPRAVPAAVPRLTRALLLRGRDRFERICAACHGMRADGSSPVARAMTVIRPPSLLDSKRMQLTDDYILTVMERGYGVMPSYRHIAGPDRIAILHYVRALQGSVVALDQLTPEQQAEVGQWLR